jgi:hypothetical protein
MQQTTILQKETKSESAEKRNRVESTTVVGISIVSFQLLIEPLDKKSANI